MKAMLIKCHKKTLFSYFEPVVTEPLELEYLKTIFNELNIDSIIYDSLFLSTSYKCFIKEFEPDMVILNGYVTGVGEILTTAKWIKEKYPHIKIIVGGVYAQINYKDFFCENIDCIVHSPSLLVFKKLVHSLQHGHVLDPIDGIAFKKGGDWILNKQFFMNTWENFKPDRTFFNEYSSKTKYLNYHNMALLNTSHSCPFNCTFCYCKLLNNGKYITRDNQDIINEIETIHSEYIWIVDDTFLVDRSKIMEFCDLLKKKNIRRKFIAYSRADFISENEDLIYRLSQLGFLDLIVGMEAVNDLELDAYDKGVNANDNIQAIEVLNTCGINLTALFIVHPHYNIKDFKVLRNFIRKYKLKVYTLSIFTPMKGTKIYEDYKDILLDVDYKKFDFLNLLIRPTKLTKLRFLWEFYKTYSLQLLYNKDYLKFFLNRLRGRLYES